MVSLFSFFYFLKLFQNWSCSIGKSVWREIGAQTLPRIFWTTSLYEIWYSAGIDLIAEALISKVCSLLFSLWSLCESFPRYYMWRSLKLFLLSVQTVSGVTRLLCGNGGVLVENELESFFILLNFALWLFRSLLCRLSCICRKVCEPWNFRWVNRQHAMWPASAARLTSKWRVSELTIHLHTAPSPSWVSEMTMASDSIHKTRNFPCSSA